MERGAAEVSSTETAVDPPDEGSQATLLGGRWTAVDLACAALVLFSVTHVASGRVSTFTPSLAVLVTAVPFGLVLLVRDAIVGHLPSRLGLLFLGSGLVSAAMAPVWFGPVLGVAQGHTSWLVYAGGLATYSLGRRVSPRGADLVMYALVAAVGLGGMLAVVQVLVAPDAGPFALYFGRPRGLSAHPIYFAQFGAAVCAIGCSLHVRERHRLAQPLVAVGTFVVALSGTLVSLAAVVLVVGLAVMMSYRRFRMVFSLLAATVAGVLASWALHASGGSSQSVVDRPATSGLQDRLDVWSYGLEAWVERPIFGWGPGRFLIATQAHYDDDFAQRFADVVWGDAHNLVVELLVTWGLAGLVLFAALLISIVVVSRGPLAWAAVGASVTVLLQPASPESWVVVGVALGVASVQRSSAPDGLMQRVAVVLAGVGLLLGTLVLAGGSREALQEGGGTSLPSGMSVWYRYDWTVALRRSGLVPVSPADVEAKLYWAERAIELEPGHSANHHSHALASVFAEDLEGARRSAERALELQPSESRALILLRGVALAQGDEAEVAGLERRLCEAGLDDYCG